MFRYTILHIYIEEIITAQCLDRIADTWDEQMQQAAIMQIAPWSWKPHTELLYFIWLVIQNKSKNNGRQDLKKLKHS